MKINTDFKELDILRRLRKTLILAIFTKFRLPKTTRYSSIHEKFNRVYKGPKMKLFHFLIYKIFLSSTLESVLDFCDLEMGLCRVHVMIIRSRLRMTKFSAEGLRARVKEGKD